MCPTAVTIHTLSNEDYLEMFEAGTTFGPQRKSSWKPGSMGSSSCTRAAPSDID